MTAARLKACPSEAEESHVAHRGEPPASRAGLSIRARYSGSGSPGTWTVLMYRKPTDRQSRLFGSTQYLSLGLISTSGKGSNLLSSKGGRLGSGAPSAARCAFAFSKPQ